MRERMDEGGRAEQVLLQADFQAFPQACMKPNEREEISGEIFPPSLPVITLSLINFGRNFISVSLFPPSVLSFRCFDLQSWHQFLPSTVYSLACQPQVPWSVTPLSFYLSVPILSVTLMSMDLRFHL